ncbi:MAG TPA: hypothetical protein VGC80_07320, partial [Acetobacteraceae bacterium]
VVEDAVGRFSARLTRVEVHLGDVNAAKHGAADKRCMMEARPNHHQPIAVTHQAATVQEAMNGAARKLVHALEHNFGRIDDPKRGGSTKDSNLP